MKKYTLKEAFEKQLLWQGDEVDIRNIYWPLKHIGVSSGASFAIKTIVNFFTNIDNELLGATGQIFREDGCTFVKITWNLSTDTSCSPDMIADKLLTDEDFGVKAIKKEDGFVGIYYHIILPDNIIVNFEDEARAVLELPMHVAYKLP